MGAVVVIATLFGALADASAQDLERGQALYEQWCAGCHGDTGAGDGTAAAFMLPEPRDFTGAVYQIRTTASGELPTDDDLRQVIDNGMPGSTMPGWRGRLSSDERDDVIGYIKTFSRFFGDGDPPVVIEMSTPPRQTDEGLAEGRQLFVEELECLKCHGETGRGTGPSAPTLSDDWDLPIYAADLSENWNFNGGGDVDDIYMRLRTGLDGTPMPSYSDALESNIVTDEQLWRVAQYVRSLSPAEPPRPRDVIRAARADSALPERPDDPRWDEVEVYYVPLVGQIIVAPRQFAPGVDALWIQALHDGERLSMRLSWDDRTQSPDPEWDEFYGWVRQAMTDVDGAMPDQQGEDRVMVQFPLHLTTSMALPYFLGGDSRRPVSVIEWTSAPDRVRVGTATGLGAFSPVPGTQDVGHAAQFDNGRWQLVVSRPLVSGDTTVAPTMPAGTPIPIAFQVADGTNGEDAVRNSVSAWYAVYLDVPVPTRVYVQPVLAGLLTAGLGLIVVFRAQRRERALGQPSEET